MFITERIADLQMSFNKLEEEDADGEGSNSNSPHGAKARQQPAANVPQPKLSLTEGTNG